MPITPTEPVREVVRAHNLLNMWSICLKFGRLLCGNRCYRFVGFKRKFLRIPTAYPTLPYTPSILLYYYFFMQLPFAICCIHYPFSLFYNNCMPPSPLSLSLPLHLSHSLVFLLNSAFKFSWPKGCATPSLTCFLSLSLLLSLCALSPSCVGKCFAFYFISRFSFRFVVCHNKKGEFLYFAISFYGFRVWRLSVCSLPLSLSLSLY